MIGDTLRMIAGGRRDHTALALLIAKKQQCVARAALLEAAGALQVIELAEDVCAGQLRQRDRLDARRLVDAAADAFARRLDVRRGHRRLGGQRRGRHGRHANGSSTPGFAALSTRRNSCWIRVSAA